MTSIRADGHELERLLAFIQQSRAFDFTGYKRPSLTRRIERRLAERRLDSFGAYQDLLTREPDEFVQLFNTILINVTAFFRDEQAWTYVREEVVPRILAASDDREIRVWSAGCATGEEAYTAAIVLAEALGEDDFRRRVKIYATDVDEDALADGRHARYGPKQVEPLPLELRERFFEQSDGRYVFRPDLRRNVIFGRHDLIQDPPISRIDLLVARNTLMYFTTETQERILRSFHFGLHEGGFLFLGKAEALAAHSPLFAPVDLKRRVFAKVTQRPIEAVPAPQASPVRAEPPPTPPALLDAALDAAPVAQVVVDRDGTVVHLNAQARLLFDLSPGDVGRPIQDLSLSYRPVELRSRIEQVQAEGRPVWIRGVEWPRDDASHVLDVQVSPLVSSTGDLVGVSVNAADVTRFAQLRDQVSAARRQLESAYEELQSTNEELETTNEELQSTNEELETTNEELQSTNEELETMNEELQSTNEELETMNDELQERTDELNEAAEFVEGVLEGMGAAVIVVDRDLQVRAWNHAAYELWGLQPDEVLGHPLQKLDFGLPVAELRAPIGRILAGDESSAATVSALTRRGRAIALRVDLAALGNQHKGVVRGAILMMRAEQPVEA